MISRRRFCHFSLGLAATIVGCPFAIANQSSTRQLSSTAPSFQPSGREANGVTALPRLPSTLLRASPNPRGDNLSCDIAEMLCDPSRLASVPDRYQLELDAFRTVSPNALQCLSEGDWLFADFGLSDVSESMARALSEIPLACADFYHVQTIPPAAIATLLAGGWDGLAFNDVVAINPDAVRELADRMAAIPKAERGWLSIRGNFHVSLELANALAELPMYLALEPASHEEAFDAGCALALSRHRGSRLTIYAVYEQPTHVQVNSGSSSGSDQAIRSEQACFYSTRFINELSSYPMKQLMVSLPIQNRSVALGSLDLRNLS